MRITNKTWAAGLFSLTLATMPAFAAETTADTVVATVGGVDITVGHMIVAKQTLPAQYQQLEPAVLFDGILDQLVQQQALAQSLGGTVTQATLLTLDNQKSGLLAGEALGKVSQMALTEEAIKAAYEARFADAEPETEFHAAHILVPSEEDAKALKAELDGGADFAALAMEKSTGPSGPNGGDLGWFGKGMMVPEFEQAVLTLEAGQVSEPVQTQFGWHVVLLNETRLADAPSLETVREELAVEIENAAVEAHLTDLMARADVTKAEVEVNPAVLNDLGLVAN